jgi:signal transduction histidine kinase
VRTALPTPAKLYLNAVVFIAAVFVAVSLILVRPEITREVLLTFVILSILSLILEFVAFPLLVDGDTSFSTVAYVATIFLLPFPLPALIGALVIASVELKNRRPVRFLAFNAANYALTLGISSLIWYTIGGATSLTEIEYSARAFLAIILVIVAFYAVNVFLTNVIIAIVGRRSIKYIWLTNDLEFLRPYVCLEVVGILAVLVWQTAPLLTPLLIVPAVTTYLAFEMIHRLQRQTQEAMIAMADAIDQRDPYTADHSRRVAEMAVLIAEKMGINERDIERLRLAARMHDIGKIGIGNDVLHKPGKLTDAEWELMRSHPVIGEQLLKPYRQFRHETALVRHHHERWDGRGYPDNLRGKTIPMGARVICVADSYDAMTSSRPYRPGMSRQHAIEEIRNGALTQFDPQVVAGFLQVMEESSKVRPINAAVAADVAAAASGG